MKKQIIVGLGCLTVILFALSMTAYAAKGSGNKGGGSYGKADKQMMKEQRQYKKQEQYQYEQEYKNKKQKGDDLTSETERQGQGGPDDAKGFAKQREKKMEQERKELGKGSETGQQQREEHSRKWWRFWE